MVAVKLVEDEDRGGGGYRSGEQTLQSRDKNHQSHPRVRWSHPQESPDAVTVSDEIATLSST